MVDYRLPQFLDFLVSVWNYPTWKHCANKKNSMTPPSEQRLSDSDSDLEVRKPASNPVNPTIIPEPRSGLIKGNEVKEMLDNSRAARERTLGLDAADERAEPVHRIGGRVVSKEEWQREKDRSDPRYKRQRLREIDAEFEKSQDVRWKQGLEQSSERRARAEAALEIADRPLGSIALDKDLTNELRSRRRWEDPLSGMNARSQHSRPKSDKPKSFFQAPSNRFNIAAGYRWDGVVRGTDFERRWFERTNENASKKRDQFRRSSHD